MMKSSTPAQIALKKLMLREFAVLEEKKNNLKGKNKTESLHKLRIAVRKTRTLLRQADSVFPERTISRFDREFKYLAQKTCKSRDLDVFLKNLEKIPLSMHDIPLGLNNKICKFILDSKNKEEDELLKYLHSARYTRLKNDWAKLINKPATGPGRSKSAVMPIDYLLQNGINKLYRKLIKQGSKIDINAAYPDYHDLRKTCKKLRYLLEYFHDLHPGKKTGSLIKSLKHTQDVLGDLQDKRTQIEMLNDFKKNRTQHGLSDEHVHLVELVIKQLDEQSMEIKSGYPEVYNELLSKFDNKTCKDIFSKKNIIEYKFVN